MVAVLTGHVEKGRDDDVGPKAPIRPDEPLDDPLLAPASQCIGAVLRKPEIMNGIVRAVSQPDHVRIDAACSLFHLGRPEDAERGAPLGPDRVLATLSAGRACND